MVIPPLKTCLSSADLALPEGINFEGYNFEQVGNGFRVQDYLANKFIGHMN